MYDTVFNDTLTEVSRRFDELIYEAFEKHGLSKETVDSIARENPKRIQCYSVNDPDRMTRSINWYLDGILIFRTYDQVRPIANLGNGCITKYEADFSVEHIY